MQFDSNEIIQVRHARCNRVVARGLVRFNPQSGAACEREWILALPRSKTLSSSRFDVARSDDSRYNRYLLFKFRWPNLKQPLKRYQTLSNSISIIAYNFSWKRRWTFSARNRGPCSKKLESLLEQCGNRGCTVQIVDHRMIDRDSVNLSRETCDRQTWQLISDR